MSALERFAQWAWYASGSGARVTRALLTPLSFVYERAVQHRNARFDRGEGVHATALPAVCVGNLSVGGTGKTPVAAWCAQQLQRMGASPAIVLRGYGDDEWREHALLSPGVPVVVNADRTNGIAEAAGMGADVAVLDDAFQHRQAARLIDLVLVSADAWRGGVRVLPAGPWREPLSSLQRASVVIITVKAATDEQVETARAAVAAAAPRVPVAIVAIEADTLVPVTAGEPLRVGQDQENAVNVSAPAMAGAHDNTSAQRLPWLKTRSVLAVSAIGNPDPFEQVLRDAGAVLTVRRFRDHHLYTATEAQTLARAVPSGGIAVCTRKDAVKLAPLWPRTAAPLWYLSQTIVVRRGSEALQAALTRVAAARHAPTAASRPTAG